jgi:hypothetical protein
VRILLLSSSRNLTAHAVASAVEQLGVADHLGVTDQLAGPGPARAGGGQVDVAVLTTQAPTEDLGVRALVVAPRGEAGGSRGRAAVLTLAWTTSGVATRAFREATLVVALDAGTHQAAWLLARRYRRPAVVAGPTAGRRFIDAAGSAP